MRFLLTLAVLAFAASAQAITISDAKIAKGTVQVKGKGALPFAPLSFDGSPVGTATKSGSFKFTTSTLPADCVGEVTDGASRAGAVIAGCTRATGPQVVDGTGRVIGPYLSDADAIYRNESVVVRGPDGPVAVSFAATGFVFTHFEVLFESGDCSGAPLLRRRTVAMPRAAGRVDGALYYAPDTATLRTIASRASFVSDPAECRSDWLFVAPNRCCCVAGCQSAFAEYADPPGTVDVSGFVPPFRVEMR